MPKHLPDFNQGSVLVIGDVMLDRYWFGETSRISPEAPIPIVRVNNTDDRPGGAGNVALNISALGSHATLLGVTGQDEAAHKLAQQLNAASVSHDLCMQANLTTIIKLRVISRHQQLLRLDFEEKMANFEQKVLVDKFRKHLKHAKLVILSDYSKGTLANPQDFIQEARKTGTPVMVDPKGNDFSIYRYADILTPNMKEFEAVVGHCKSEHEIISKGRKLLAEYDLGALLVTRGEDGMTLIEKDSSMHLPAYAREVFDVTGAGDTVIGVLAASIASGADLQTAVALANLGASQVVSKLGAAAISAPELHVALTGKTTFRTGIVNDEQLQTAVSEIRAKGKKVVFANGCFDIIHAGHVTYLQMAKQVADYLIVAVNTDESIKKLKGPDRPINHLDHRMTVLAGLGMVDWVIPFNDETPERLLKMIKPDFLVKGGDYTLDQVVGADIVRAYGGEVRIMNHNIKTTSTSLLDRLQHQELEHESL
ncbi:MAG TPA: bifunctional D-glycero-beta-D-manno-heptose-7-phosphate kinase/D-glycero-beta-D-manno-heptose 1-phosphate adenylyltransferase HldE [Gammaproteobacteria bacterium]|nr:bifunctional D-glycero-beta-D-manno-heptose-7-phosphate kinase/D-glycero-beta-D-manno-heptose 1-phosphate adenylyltransferase HldE [Gammaproteobacteria bacterium]